MLDAAERVFSASGFHGASMDAIAAEAGISKPMVYNYFGSKEGIYLAYLARAGRDLLNRMLAADVPDGSLAGAPDRRRGGLLRLRGREPRRLAGAARGDAPASASRSAARWPRCATRSTRCSRRSCWRRGQTPQRVDAFARALTGAGESLADWWLEHPDTPVEVLVETLVAMAGAAAPAR